MEDTRSRDKRVCVICGSDKTYSVLRKIGASIHYQWYNIKGNWHCARCYGRLINGPRQSPTRNKKRMRFKDRIIFLPYNPRKGVCTWCGKKKGEPFLDHKNKVRYVRTAMHHIEYHEDDPLKDAIELCSSCHGKEGLRLGQLTGIMRKSNF